MGHFDAYELANIADARSVTIAEIMFAPAFLRDVRHVRVLVDCGEIEHAQRIADELSRLARNPDSTELEVAA